MSFLLGIMVVVIRFMQKHSGSLYDSHTRENWITILLLLMTCVTPFFILLEKSNKEKE